MKCFLLVSLLFAVAVSSSTAGLVTPKVCKLPKAQGSCKASIPKYFYNGTSEQCEQFIYGGCQGNANRFHKIEDCKKLCVPKRTPTTTTLPTTVPTTAVPGHSLIEALLKMESSLIRIMNAVNQIPKIKDSTRKEMLKFHSELYQAVKRLHTLQTITSSVLPMFEVDQINLALKAIRYKSSSAIMRLNRLVTPEVCKLPKAQGPCKASIPKYFYNDTSEQCELFIYGGCQGNANNFDKIEDCKKLCVRKRICPKDKPFVMCFADPCSVSSCPAYIVTSRCQSNYCGGCNAVYYDQYNIRIPSSRCHCQPNEATVTCIADPCMSASCPSHPNAKCRARLCGSCTAEFVEADGSIIKAC